MNNLVIDLTHGGVKIAISLAKKGKNVLAFDIYNTLKSIDAKMLAVYDVDLIQLSDLADFKGDMNVIYPVHLPLTKEEIMSYNPDLNYTFQTHHEAVFDLLNGWGGDIPKVEVTGVKGKTSFVFMLKEILIDKNPLILSSLGSLLYENEKEFKEACFEFLKNKENVEKYLSEYILLPPRKIYTKLRFEKLFGGVYLYDTSQNKLIEITNDFRF